MAAAYAAGGIGIALLAGGFGLEVLARAQGPWERLMWAVGTTGFFLVGLGLVDGGLDGLMGSAGVVWPVVSPVVAIGLRQMVRSASSPVLGAGAVTVFGGVLAAAIRFAF